MTLSTCATSSMPPSRSKATSRVWTRSGLVLTLERRTPSSRIWARPATCQVWLRRCRGFWSTAEGRAIARGRSGHRTADTSIWRYGAIGHRILAGLPAGKPATRGSQPPACRRLDLPRAPTDGGGARTGATGPLTRGSPPIPGGPGSTRSHLAPVAPDAPPRRRGTWTCPTGLSACAARARATAASGGSW